MNTETLVLDNKIQINEETDFLFKCKEGLVVNGKLSFSRENGVVGAWINYSLVCHVRMRKDKFVFTDINDRNVELYDDVPELKREQGFDDLLVIHMNLDDFSESIGDYGDIKGLEYIKDLIKDSDNPNKTIINDWKDYLLKNS